MAPSIEFEVLDSHHLDDVRRMIGDPDILRLTRVPDPPPGDFVDTWYSMYARGRVDGTREGFAIVDTEDRSFVGLVLAPAIDSTARTLELGYIVAPWARGRGVATEALRRLTRWAFDHHDAMRLELQISTANTPSKRVAERAGYRFEGVLRSLYFKQDRWEDTEVWSRLASDPPPDPEDDAARRER